MAGYDGDVLFRLEVSDGWVSNFSDSLRFKVDLPGVDRDVYVRITPFDNDTGVQVQRFHFRGQV